jgi:WhiB family transcriptional regulator, redox-sensing transcriptional regulator
LIDSWVEDAACKGMDVNLFFPELGKSHISEKVVKPICNSCPVQQSCLNYALKNDLNNGYYGGLSGKQRRIIKSKRRAERLNKVS